jgi:hypothetical protein
MLGSDDDFAHGVALSNTYYVAAATFIDHFTDFAVESSVGKGLLLTRIYLDYDACAIFVFV